MEKHIQTCAVKEDIPYSFNNEEIIYFQDNFKYLGDVSFRAYFVIKTTADDSDFFDPKMFIVS